MTLVCFEASTNWRSHNSASIQHVTLHCMCMYLYYLGLQLRRGRPATLARRRRARRVLAMASWVRPSGRWWRTRFLFAPPLGLGLQQSELQDELCFFVHVPHGLQILGFLLCVPLMCLSSHFTLRGCGVYAALLAALFPWIIRSLVRVWFVFPHTFRPLTLDSTLLATRRIGPYSRRSRLRLAVFSVTVCLSNMVK